VGNACKAAGYKSEPEVILESSKAAVSPRLPEITFLGALFVALLIVALLLIPCINTLLTYF
jgi:hypothetical protein